MEAADASSCRDRGACVGTDSTSSGGKIEGALLYWTQDTAVMSMSEVIEDTRRCTVSGAVDA